MKTIKRYGIDKTINNIRIVEITPILMMEKWWLCVGFEEKNIPRGDQIHLAFIFNKEVDWLKIKDLFKHLKTCFKKSQKPLVRIHSECLLGDALFSSLCDCGKQLSGAVEMMLKAGIGVLIYLRQEGRGIGMRTKLSCLALQEGFVKGIKKTRRHTPDEANLKLGYPVDKRDYGAAAKFLQLLNIQAICLISGNCEKKEHLENEGIIIDSLLDISRKNNGGRELIEIREKLTRNYHYPQMKKSFDKF